jgi:ATP-dependent DNA ligase
VIGGYKFGATTFDALVFGYFERARLLYVARTRNGFTPTLRADLMKRFEKLRTDKCPFANLPEQRTGRWGAGFTTAKMKDCQWLKPELVGQFEFLEWTPENHLRHTRFVGLREDKAPNEIRREGNASGCALKQGAAEHGSCEQRFTRVKCTTNIGTDDVTQAGPQVRYLPSTALYRR